MEVSSRHGSGTTISYSIVDGQDSNHFAINASTGALTFVGNRDAELPGDVNRDSVDIVNVQTSDGLLTAMQILSVTVASVNEALVPPTSKS
jgi:hypothetical protein